MPLRWTLVTGAATVGLLAVASSACSSPGFSSHGAPSPESHSTSGANTGFTTRGSQAPPPAARTIKSPPPSRGASSSSGSAPAAPTASASFGPAPSPNPLPPPPPPMP